MPHPSNVRATPQPNVPAPNSNTFNFDNFSTSNEGNARHFINRKFKSFACRDKCAGDTSGRKSMERGPGLLFLFSSQPTHRYNDRL